MSQPAHSEQQDAPIASEAVRIARLMGLPKWSEMSDLALVKRIETGLPLHVVEKVARVISPDDRVAKFALVSRSTYSRLRKKPKRHLTKDMSEKLYGLARVLDEASRLWNGDGKAVARFLNRPHPLLERRTPFDVAKESTVGADLVVKIIGEARAGVAV